MDPQAESGQRRPLLLLVGTGRRQLREYLMSSMATRYRLHLFLVGEPTWEVPYLQGYTRLKNMELKSSFNTTHADDMIEAAKQVAAADPIDGVLAWDEARILQCAKVAAALGLPGGDPEMVMRCRDKQLTREALGAAGVPQPRSVVADDMAQALAAADAIGYPVIVKPRAMAASLGVVKVSNADELTQQFSFARDTMIPGAWHYDSVLVEEFVEGPEVSVDAVVHQGEVFPICIARKEIGFPPYCEEVGHLVDGADPLLADPTLMQIVNDAHAALRFTDGATHTEIKLSSDGMKIIEVNGRLGGDMIPYLGLRTTGIDPGLAAAAVACGQAPDVKPSRSLVGGVRFFYVDKDDTTVESIGFADVDLPSAVDLLVPLVEPGATVSPPPKGTWVGRIAFATAVGADADECRRALDAAGAALHMTSTNGVRIAEHA